MDGKQKTCSGQEGSSEEESKPGRHREKSQSDKRGESEVEMVGAVVRL